MKTKTADFKKSLARVRRVAEGGKVDRALAALEKMLITWLDHPRLLVEKARLIQLSERGDLTEAKRALKRATEVYATSADAWLELGFFLYCVEDRTVDAESMFDQAINLAVSDLTQAVAGKIDAVIEQTPDSFAQDRLAEMEDLHRLARFLSQKHGKSDSWGIRKLRDAIADLQQKMRGGANSERNGK